LKSKFAISSALSVVSSALLSEGISTSRLKSQLSEDSSFGSSAGISKSTVVSAASEATVSCSSFPTLLKSKSHTASLFTVDDSCAAFEGVSNETSNDSHSSFFSSPFCSDVISEKSKSKLSSVGLEILSNFSRLSKTSCEPQNSGFLASLA
jgi:hypothetical protein